MTGLVIRPWVPSDGPRFLDLAAQLGYPADLDTMRTQVTHRLGRLASDGGPEAAWFLAEVKTEGDEGLVVGWGSVQIVENGYRPAYGDLMGLVVDEAWRSRGIGKALLAAVEAWLQVRGVGELSVRSGGTRLEAHRFYEREGCRRLKTQVVFRKPIPGPQGG